MPLRIASWNVNSIRVRIEHAGQVVEKYQPDLLCLQETKAADPVFPAGPFHDWGYTHQALSGAVGAPGVAILSRRPFVQVVSRNWCGRDDHRHVGVALENGLWVDNFYVPAGGDVPDPARNPKFAHKLRFLEEMTAHYQALNEAGNKANPGAGRVLVGDLNVAPLQTDVWSHAKLRGKITHTEVEIAALTKLQDAFEGIDLMRRFVAPDLPLFTWWSYRAQDWTVANRGRRLDHVWGTAAAAAACIAMTVAQETRSWPRPSDHVPVIVDFDVP